MKKYGIISALDVEIQPCINAMQQTGITKKIGLTFYEGFLHGIPVVAVAGGICKTNAAICTQMLLMHFGVDAVIVCGTAGGMDTRLHIGDTVIVSVCAYHDVEDGILVKYPPYLQKAEFYADAQLLELFQDAIQKNPPQQSVFYGLGVCGEQFIEQDGRDEIMDKFNPLCVDMETAAVAHACYVHGAPFIGIRSISDTQEESGEKNFELNCALAADSSFTVLNLVFAHLQSRA